MPKEYIDREKAMEIVKRTSGDYAAAWSEIRQLPAADVAPVVHGEWIASYDGFHDLVTIVCSLCGHTGARHFHYCVHCGAKMDGVKNDQKTD